MMRKVFLSGCLSAMCLLTFSQAKSPQASFGIQLDAAPMLYDRMIFGQFIEHFHRQIYGGIFEPGSKLSDEQGFRKDVIEALRELKVPVVRWPGGCFVSSYHWLNGVGPVRTPAYDKAWHVEDPNTFGTDEFVAWCRKIGAEPYICTNAGTGTPEEMSDWVEYCNLKDMGKYAKMRIANGHPEPYNVKYWSIGNENYGAWEMGAKTVDEWGNFVRESAKLMFNVDFDVKLFAAARADTSWTIPLLKRAGEFLDVVSIHGYWDRLAQVNNPSDYLTCMRFSVMPETSIKSTIDIIKRTGFDGKIKIAFDEWNLRGWHHPGHGMRTKEQDIKARDLADINSTYTMADALFSASFLNSCIRNCNYVMMACMAPVVNTRGPLFVYPDGIVKRTTFHVMSMYANHLQPNIIPLKITSDGLEVPAPSAGKKQSIPVIDAIVTCSDDKKSLAIAIVNKHPDKAMECDLGLGNFSKKAEAVILTGDSTEAFNDINKPDRVVPEEKQLEIKNSRVIVPAHSLTILKIRL
jgi:alpha-L-arabinofuranosidase